MSIINDENGDGKVVSLDARSQKAEWYEIFHH